MTHQELQVLNHLSQFVSDHKKQFIDKVLDFRTRHITVVLEDIYQSQNASAVIRTCECMGLQDVHIIEQKSKYEINRRVLKGADKWMTLYQYREKNIQNTKSCFDALRETGYKILGTDPSGEGISIHEIDVTENKVALVFGNELRGISAFAQRHCDQQIKIPMYGFTESLNVSVSVAICLSAFLTKLHASRQNLFLTEQEKQVLKLSWFRKIVRRSGLIEKEFLRTIE
jgi:tRNA (guanosine-2'-O-)-methyltransferase